MYIGLYTLNENACETGSVLHQSTYPTTMHDKTNVSVDDSLGYDEVGF